MPGECRGIRWGAGGGLGGRTEAGTEGASGLPEQPPLQHFVLLLGRLAHHLPGERHRETPCRASTGAPSAGTGAVLSPPPRLPTTARYHPALTSPSRVSMVLIITVFLVCTSEPRCSGLVSASKRTQEMGPQGHVARGHSSGTGLTPPQLMATPKRVPPRQGVSVAPMGPQPARLAAAPQEGDLPPLRGLLGTGPRFSSSWGDAHLGN